ncbi:MAG: low specificity L-threonine aldolase [Oscillospiraceae bacterium]|nr:low specificity L-threonine aldolase [Oscillospiraceae bacterium]
MLYFVNDYSAGCHEKVMQRLAETNLEKQAVYGEDIYSLSAKEKIRKACDCENAEIVFISGGTQTNQLAIDSLLLPHEGVVCAESGHINVHESGAIEYTGHKVLTLPEHDGKIEASELRDFMQRFYADENYEHCVFPGLVYITFPTEFGALYSRKELEALRKVCDEYKLSLYMDGARLGYGLACRENELTLADIAELTDAFYIGGNKVGALFGEALVFTKNNMPRHFITHVKRHGALMAKGRVLGVQFDALFTDDLYMEIGRHAMRLADKLRAAFEEKGYQFFKKTPTNQIIIVVDDEKKVELEKKVAFSFWEKLDETHTAIRFVTDWATREEDVDALIELL